LLAWLDNRSARHEKTGPAGSAAQIRPDDLQKYHAKTFTVVNVVDGDTIDIDIPDGRHEHTRIRLWGIDSPETNNPKTGPMYFGHEAAAFVTKIAMGRQVRVYLDKANRTRGYYGRLLAYVQLPDNRFLNELLLQQGYAYADLRFRHSLYNKYKQLDSAARSQRKGLWKNVKRNQLPEWLQRLRPTLLRDKQRPAEPLGKSVPLPGK